MNRLRLVLYNNTRILCVCLSVCLCVCVCLSNLRYPEWEVVAPRCLHHLEELRLASCTNCFLSLYNEPFERKGLWKFFHQLLAEFQCTHRYTSGYSGQDESCSLLDLC